MNFLPKRWKLKNRNHAMWRIFVTISRDVNVTKAVSQYETFLLQPVMSIWHLNLDDANVVCHTNTFYLIFNNFDYIVFFFCTWPSPSNVFFILIIIVVKALKFFNKIKLIFYRNFIHCLKQKRMFHEASLLLWAIQIIRHILGGKERSTISHTTSFTS